VTDQSRWNNFTLLAVLAHPDDETFGTGGTLAYYACKGVSVHLVCATRGEVGEMSPDMMQGFSSIAEVREHELRCASQTLGLSGVYFLDYRDSGMPGSPDNRHPQALAAQPISEVAAKVVSHIRRLKPQVVITFDPIGGYRHPDHIAIHEATVQAFHLAAQADYQDAENLPPHQADKLYYQTISRGYLRAGIFLWRITGHDPRKFGKNKDIDMLAIADVNYPIHARINYGDVMELRDQASACHASQGGKEMSNGVNKWLRRIFSATELFIQAYPVPKKHQTVKDLFAGLRNPG
jgi:LmbE family N-acetylglucosaminyl deacetylase